MTSNEFDDAFNTIFSSGSGVDGDTGGMFGVGSESSAIVHGKDGGCEVETRSRRPGNHEGFRAYSYLGGANALPGDVEDGFYGTKFNIPVVEDFDLDALQGWIEKYAGKRPPKSVAIVGGGYVGVEMAEAFHAHDLDIHLFQRGDRVLKPFGEDVGKAVCDRLEAKGIDLHLGTEVKRLSGTGHVDAVVTEDGRTPVNCALVGVGIEPNTEVVSGTDVMLGESGAIAVDDFGQTTADGVYAAGDVAEMRHAVTGEYDWVPLGLTANRAGRAIGRTVAGDPEPIGDIAGTAVVKAFELECGRAGILDHGRARKAGFDPVSETVTARSRSGYYPGSEETLVHMVADRETGQVLGGAIVGEDRAAIRIDTLSTALEANLTVTELERLDLAYAPPFSPVWDPILVAAKVLRGSLED
jgi:pyruvate/2-oxoglutarate dehydrogenase complex dihydrolipoamide dehydrogenase (E3) component